MNDILNYYNGFGIEPKNTYISAGTDYFIPNIDSTNETLVPIVETAFSKSYNVSVEDQQVLKEMFTEVLGVEVIEHNWHNILHLYLALQSRVLENIRELNGNIEEYFIEDIYYFCENYLVFDKDNKPGLCVNTGDHLFINSGIKVALNQSTAGLYVNKSGMGTRGWDVRAQLVDEDYSGYVHLSCAFTMNTKRLKPRTIYCGDKITQMMVVNVKHNKMVSKTLDEYNEIMKDSNRGDNGFGSSDVKH